MSSGEAFAHPQKGGGEGVAVKFVLCLVRVCVILPQRVEWIFKTVVEEQIFDWRGGAEKGNDGSAV